MSPAVHITLVLFLALTFYQDWKYRAVHWFIFPILAVDALLIFFLREWDLQILGLNLTFVITVVTLLFIYISVRERKWTNIFERHLGIGDVLFFLAVTPLFSSQNYILFFITGMMVSGLAHGILSLLKKRESIPLAGYLSVYVIALEAVRVIFDKDLFHYAF